MSEPERFIYEIMTQTSLAKFLGILVDLSEILIQNLRIWPGIGPNFVKVRFIVSEFGKTDKFVNNDQSTQIALDDQITG